MYYSASTLDDLLYKVFEELLKRPFNIVTSRGLTSEIIGAYLKLENPLARLSRSERKSSIFSALGELLWYLARSADVEFISHYVSAYCDEVEENSTTIHGAYGPRLFSSNSQFDQISNVINLLRNKPNSRRGVIQLFEARDISNAHRNIPCTIAMQLILRDGSLKMITSMRSNDAYIGLAHDIFTFTMIQEIIANSLGVEVGDYLHLVGSLHMYRLHQEKSTQFLKEGFQTSNIAMPKMPTGDPWPSIHKLLALEGKIRGGYPLKETDYNQLDPYWRDLVHLLRLHVNFKKQDLAQIKAIHEQLSTNVYDTFINARTARRKN